MPRSTLAKIISGYVDPYKEGESHANTGKRFYSKKISGSVTVKTKKFLEYRPVRILKRISDLFSYAPAKTYGVLFLTFGILSLIIGFSKNYFGALGQVPLSSLIISAAFAILSVPLILVDVPVSVMLERFKPTEVVFFEFFCIKRLYYTGNEPAPSPFVGAFMGALLAALGAFVPVWTVALGIGIVIFTAVSFLSPEFTFFSSLLALPYVSVIPGSTLILSAAATVGAVSFARKALFGKRVICLEQYDAVIWIMLFGILISGIFVKGLDSFLNALVMCSAFFGYFLASNSVTNRRLADCAINAVALSSIPAAVISIVRFAVFAAKGEISVALNEGISSVFKSVESAAAFFLVAVVFSLIRLRQSHRLRKKLADSALLVLNLCALCLTAEAMALVALLLGGVAYYSVRTGRRMLPIIPLLLIAPYALLLIPEEFILSLPFTVYPEKVHTLFSSSLKAFLGNAFTGIGIGEGSFVAEMDKYGVSGFTDSSNLFLELGLEAGAITLIAFILLLVIRLVHRYSYRRYVRHSQVSKLSPFISMAVFSLLIFGSFNYLFSDLTVTYLFWCVFGIGSGALRVAKSEYDDRILYFEDEKSFDSAVINLHLR